MTGELPQPDGAIYPSLMSSLGLQFSGTGETPGRTANRHSGLAESPYNVYPAADGISR